MMEQNCREVCALLRCIVDRASANGRGCVADVSIDGHCAPLPRCGHTSPCRCAEFISAQAGPCVSLRCATIEPMRGGHGCCVRAELVVPVTILLCLDGRNTTCTGDICIPVEGRMGQMHGLLPELVAQASVFVRKGCIIDGCIRLWVDYSAEIFGICQKAMRVPTLGPCENGCDCQPFFNLPLYPQGM